jgi:hypothetical protein
MLLLLLALISPPRLFDVVLQKSFPSQGIEQERTAVSFASESQIAQWKRGDLIELPTSRGYEPYRVVRVASFVPGTLSITAEAIDGSGDHVALTFDGSNVTGIAQSIRDNRYDVFGSGIRAKVALADLDHISCGADELHDPSDHLPDAMRMSPIERVHESVKKMVNEAQSTGLDSVTIDLLMVYTPKAQIWADTASGTRAPGSFNAAVAQAMNLSQQAFDMSQLAIKLRMVHLHKTNYDEASGANSTIHLQRLTARAGDTGWPEGTLGYMDEVHDLREQYGADLVALLADVSDTGGIAWRLGSYGGRPQNGFSLNRIRQTHFTYTLVHEIGHNMGSSHGRRPTQTSSPANRFGGLHAYSVGYRWTANTGAGFVTVMHYESEGFSRTPYFSSTSQMVDGVAIGSSLPDSLGADNSRSLMEIRRVIANYRATQVQPSNLTLPSLVVVDVARGATKQADILMTNIGSGDAMWGITRVYRPLTKGMDSQSHSSEIVYQTGFESNQGYPSGFHSMLQEWRSFNTNIQFQISTLSPKSGSQHMRWSQSGGLGIGSYAFIDSPQFSGSRAGTHTLSFDFRQSNPGSRFDMYAYDTFTNTMAVGWIVDAIGTVFVRPGPSTGSFSFLGQAPIGQYHSVSAEVNPSDGKIRYRLNGGPASESEISGKTRLNFLTFVPQNTAGSIVDLDNIRVELNSAYLPGFVFAQNEGTVRPGQSALLPLMIDAQDLAIGTYVGLLDIQTDSGVKTARIQVNVLDPLSADDGKGALPSDIELAQNFPNPFNPTTEIRYRVGTQDLASLHQVRLSVYDLLGREIAVLVDGMQTAGAYTVTFDASSLASGVYVYTLRVGDRVVTKKMLLMK